MADNAPKGPSSAKASGGTSPSGPGKANTAATTGAAAPAEGSSTSSAAGDSDAAATGTGPDPERQEPGGAAGEAGQPANTDKSGQPVAGSAAEDPNVDGVASGASETGGDTPDPDDEPSLSKVSKDNLVAQAAAIGSTTEGTKEEIAQGIKDAGGAIAIPKGPNGCLTDPDCVRPAHPLTPNAHASGRATSGIGS